MRILLRTAVYLSAVCAVVASAPLSQQKKDVEWQYTSDETPSTWTGLQIPQDQSPFTTWSEGDDEYEVQEQEELEHSDDADDADEGEEEFRHKHKNGWIYVSFDKAEK
jgi:carbonic anhydrase